MDLKLRDRDYIVGLNGLVFRVLGYVHPPDGYICDLEYVPAALYKSRNPKAPRGYPKTTHYKLYGDEPFRLVKERFPEYTVYYKPLARKLPGVPRRLIKEVLYPADGLKRVVEGCEDELCVTLRRILNKITEISGLRIGDFGVFGSLLLGLHHPVFSDLDLVIYGSDNLKKLRSCLEDIYKEEKFMVNEFKEPPRLNWRFIRYPYKLFLAHQRRKLIYGVYKPPDSVRPIKVEFEPVKSLGEISGEYMVPDKVDRLGWVKAVAKVVDDSEAAFMPSVYRVELETVLEGPSVDSIDCIVSYVEEYRLQAFRDERVYVEGWLERIQSGCKIFHQITLTYGPRYYDQTLYSLTLLKETCQTNV